MLTSIVERIIAGFDESIFSVESMISVVSLILFELMISVVLIIFAV